MGAGYSADILCTVTLEARQERRDQGSLSNFLYSRCIIVFNTSKVVSTKPSLFHLQIFRGDEAAAASCPQNNGELWLAEAGSRDHCAHLWLVRCCCPSCWCWPCRSCSACPPSSTPGSWGELWLVEPQYSPLIGGAEILTSDWSGRPTTGTSATCTGPTATPGTRSWTSCESWSISWIVWCYDIHVPFVQIRTSEEL